MKDQDKSKSQLISELQEMRKQLLTFKHNDGQQKSKAEIKKVVQEKKLGLGKFASPIEDSYHILDADFKIVQMSKEALDAIYQVDPTIKSKNDVLGKSITHFYPFLKDELVHFYEVIKTGKKYKNERIISHSELGNFIISFTCFKLGDDIGIFIENITARRCAEENIQSSEIKFRSIFERSLNAIGVSKSGIHTMVNPAYLNLFGYENEEELIGTSILDLVALSEQEKISNNLQARSRGENISKDYETKGRRKNGSEFDAHVCVSSFILGEEENTFVILRDITNQKKTETALKESELLYRSLIESTSAVAWEVDIASLKFTYISPNILNVTGYRSELWIDFDYWVKRIHPEDRVEAAKFCTAQTGKGADHSFEYRLIAKDGKIKWIRDIVSVIKDRGQPAKLRGFFIDTTEYKEVEIALKKNQQRFEDFSLIASDYYWELDSELRYSYLSKHYEKFSGKKPEEILGKTRREMYEGIIPKEKETWNKFLNTLDAHEDFRDFIYTYIRLDGTHRIFANKGKAIFNSSGEFRGYRGVGIDITEHKLAEDKKVMLEEQLHHSQKLETIGTLAGGIAHDFNNSLTPILGYTDMIVAELPESDPLQQYLSNVLEGAHRAKDLVEQILLFSKQIEREPIPLSMRFVVKKALHFLRSSIPTTINIVQRLNPRCGNVMADATQIHQVIVNLCTNAWHAMEKTGGTLTLELKQVKVDAAMAKSHPTLDVAEYIQLTVKDTGCGMDKSTSDRIFEPFFTTKAVDKGTGLGLSVVHGIVQNNQGEIFVESEPGKGTVFQVYLPVFQQEIAIIGDKQKTVESGSESILVVDDDSVVGKMIKQMLVKLGYKIDLHGDSPSALKAFKKNPEYYDLIISDFTMPDLTGLDLAQQTQKIDSSKPIIIITGYGEKFIGIDQGTYGIKKILQKPLIRKDLAFAIRRVLDNKES